MTSTPPRARLLAPAALLLFLPLASCALSRQDELKQMSQRVEDRLYEEQRRVLQLPPTDAERAGRIEHLNKLRYSLSAANVGLSSIPRVVPPDFRDIAYDTVEEAYGAINWSIPLGPYEPRPTLPVQFDFSSLAPQ